MLAELSLGDPKAVAEEEEAESKDNSRAPEGVLALQALESEEQVVVDATVKADPQSPRGGEYREGHEGAYDYVYLGQHEHGEQVVH